jgi:hypothetical protein
MRHYDFISPINLWNYPFMTHSEERRRANSLKLRPVKRPKAASRISIEPNTDVDIRAVQGDRMRLCVEISQRVGRRF